MNRFRTVARIAADLACMELANGKREEARKLARIASSSWQPMGAEYEALRLEEQAERMGEQRCYGRIIRRTAGGIK